MINFADDVQLDEVFAVFVVLLILHALINIYSSHLVALFNNISVFWHVVGVAVIIGILIIVPDRHQSADFVFTETFNNSGFSGGSTGSLFFWAYVLPVGFLLTMYTVTGYDASAHVSEETREAEQAAAKGIWQSVFFSAIIGWFVLLAITFAAVDTKAIDAAGGYLAGRVHERDVGGLGRDGDSDLVPRPGVLRHGVRHERVAHVLRLLARPRGPGLASVEQRQREARLPVAAVLGVVRAGPDHHDPRPVGNVRGHPGRVLRRRLGLA